MKTRETIDDNSGSMTKLLSSLDQECNNCAPVSPLECIANCNVWKFRNEFRTLCETMANPNFMKNLLNALKNETRLAIMQLVVGERYSIGKLQGELKKHGYIHSQDNLMEEYLRPLLSIGLVTDSNFSLNSTTFGKRLLRLIANLPDFAKLLPSNSECYEETILRELLDGPKNFEEIKELIPYTLAPRVLKRLSVAGLIWTNTGREYVFFFRSKRDQSKESLTVTENKLYRNITEEGISVKKLAKNTCLSIRRTYKYLRGLKGKKLVFTRKTPKRYTLTEKGERLAWIINEIVKLVEETFSFSEEFRRHKENS